MSRRVPGSERKQRGELPELAASLQSLLTSGKRTDKWVRVRRITHAGRVALGAMQLQCRALTDGSGTRACQ